MREDPLDDRLFQDRRNALELANEIRAVLRRKDVHGFAERPTNQTTPKRPLPSARKWPGVTVRGCAFRQPFDVRDRDARGAATAQKRAVQPRALERNKAFGKDWIRRSHSGRYDMSRLKETTLLLVARDAPLGPEWLTKHPLLGEWTDHRECHVGGDSC